MSDDAAGTGRAAAPDEAVPPSAEELAGELARAEAERDAAVAALDKKGRRERRRVKARRGLVGVLVVLFSLLLTLTFVIAWAHKVALDTDGFESTVGPLVDKPAVTAAVSAAVTDQIFTALNPQQIVANALPPKAAFLAGPVTNGAKGYVQDGVTKALQSSQFRTLWLQATRFAHSQLVAVLEGKGHAVTTTNGQVVLNLVPLLNAALQNLQGFASGVVGKPIKLPTITANEVPSAACQKIATALSRPLPPTCGQIALFPASKLKEAQRAVRVLNRILVLLFILTPVVAALALWLSRRRRRTLLQLCAGGILGLVVGRRVVAWLGSALVNTGKPENKAARQAIVAQLFHAFFSVSRWLLIGLVIILVVALVTGPYPWAQSVRHRAQHLAREGANLAGAAVGRARDDATVEWVRSHLDLLRILGVAVAVLLLLVVSVSFIGFLIIAVLLAAYEWWLWRFGQSLPPSPPSTSPPPDASGSPDDHSLASGEAGAARAL